MVLTFHGILQFKEIFINLDADLDQGSSVNASLILIS